MCSLPVWSQPPLKSNTDLLNSKEDPPNANAGLPKANAGLPNANVGIPNASSGLPSWVLINKRTIYCLVRSWQPFRMQVENQSRSAGICNVISADNSSQFNLKNQTFHQHRLTSQLQRTQKEVSKNQFFNCLLYQVKETMHTDNRADKNRIAKLLLFAYAKILH